MNRALDQINKLLEMLVVANLAAMTFLVFLNVVLRYAANSGITLSEELSRILFEWLTFHGAVLALARHEHVAMNALVEKLPEHWRIRWPVVIDIILCAVSILLVIGCGKLAIQNMSNKMPITGIPFGVNYLACCLMATLFTLTLLARIRERLRSISKGDIL